MRSADAASLEALRAWGAAREAALRGLVHALSNRVGTVVAASALLEVGGAEAAGRVLGGEAERLEALLALFRAATADPFAADAAPEPVVVADAVAEAAALHTHAAAGYDAPIATAGVDGAPPVLAPRTALVHAVLVLLAGAGEGAVLCAEAAPDAVRLRLEPSAAPGSAAAAAWLLSGASVRAGEGAALVLPRLGAVSPG